MNIKHLLKIQNDKYPISDILQWIWHTSQGNRKQTIINAIIGILEVGVSLSCVWAMKNAIDMAQFHHPANEIYLAVGLLTALYLTNMGLRICNIWIKNILGIKAQNRMQQRMLWAILHSEWQSKKALHSGDILNRLELDVQNIINFITELLPNILSILVLFLGAFYILASLDLMLACVVVVIIPIAILFSRFYMRRMRSYTRDVRNSDSKVQSILQETIQNRMLIKALEKNDVMIERLDDTQSILREQVRHRTRFSVASHLMINIGFLTGYLIAFLWGALRLAAGTLTFGSMTAFLQLVNRIQSPARDLMRLAPQSVSVLTAAERLMELQDMQLEEQGPPHYLKGTCGIRFKNISFAYDGEKVLNNIDFDFAPGTCTAVVGETGTGKTTLIRMILALLHPQEGKVYIYNNVENTEVSPRTRCNLIYVPQGNTLLSGTIRENLYLGNINATDKELHSALRKACADFCFDLPNGLNTRCGEGGAGLSEGQAQRIAIARALLREGSVMLLDEATSALDIQTEKQLLHNLLSENDKTIIFVTHRLGVTDYCDKTLSI